MCGHPIALPQRWIFTYQKPSIRKEIDAIIQSWADAIIPTLMSQVTRQEML